MTNSLHSLPIPSLYRTSNCNTIPNIDTKWVNSNGTTIRIIDVITSKSLPIINIKYINNEEPNKGVFIISLDRFHSCFSQLNKNYIINDIIVNHK